MTYDITQLSHDDAQLVGEILTREHKRIVRKIRKEEENLEYQHECRAKYQRSEFDTSWSDAVRQTEMNLQVLRSQKGELEHLFRLMKP